jgi:transmembrane protein EpsG
MVVATKNWIFARFDIYFGLYNLILISWIIKLISNRHRAFIYMILVICYLAYFYYEQVITLHIQYNSDFLKW